MKATSLLEGHHRSVAELLDRLALEEMDHSKDLPRLANCLRAHTVIEWEAFYPVIVAIDPDIVRESHEEHALADSELERLLATEPSHPAFRARLTALKEAIECHMEEEEQELFPIIEREWGEHELRELGDSMSVRFEQIRKGSLPPMLETILNESTVREAAMPVLQRNFHWRSRTDHRALRQPR